MGKALRELRNYYGLYLRDGVPGLLLLLLLGIFSWDSGFWESVSLKSGEALSLNVYSLPVLSWVIIMAVLVAPGIGLVVNQVGLIAFEGWLDKPWAWSFIGKLLMQGRHVKVVGDWSALIEKHQELLGTDDVTKIFKLEIIASAWLQRNAKDDWYARETISGAVVMQRSLAIVCLIGFGVFSFKFGLHSVLYCLAIITIILLFASAGSLVYRRYYTISRYIVHTEHQRSWLLHDYSA